MFPIVAAIGAALAAAAVPVAKAAALGVVSSAAAFGASKAIEAITHENAPADSPDASDGETQKTALPQSLKPAWAALQNPVPDNVSPLSTPKPKETIFAPSPLPAPEALQHKPGPGLAKPLAPDTHLLPVLLAPTSQVVRF